MYAILITLSLTALVAEEVERDQLIRLVEGSASSLEDLAFEYEGDQRVPRREEREAQGLGPEGITNTYAGTYALRADGAVRVEMFSIDHFAKLPTHGVLAARAGTMESIIQLGGQKNAQVEMKQYDPMEFQKTGCYSRILQRDILLAQAKSSREYRCEGTRDLDGNSCLVVVFTQPANPNASASVRITERFWIDLKRGGHVLRSEHHWNDDLVSALSDVRLDRFEARSGREVWLPVHGRFETHVAFDIKQRKPYYPKKPVSIETYDMLENTLRLEQGLTDDVFTVKAKPGDLVSDELNKARYEFGKYLVRAEADRPKPVSDAEIRANLDRMLNDADVMKNELKASSPARSGPDWTTYTPWAVSALALAGVVVLLVRRRAGV